MPYTINMSARDFFLGKRIAVVGLGPHGEMIADIKYLVKLNALVSVYDLRSEGRLGEHMTAVRALGLANFLAGEVPAEDLLDMDLIILSPEYSRHSSFLAEARKKNLDIVYPETLFLKLAPPVNVIGIMGACGKSTVISMLAPMLEAAHRLEGREHCLVIDPEDGHGVLAQLKTLKNGDTVVMRLTTTIMPEIHALKWSPQTAVFTTIPSGVSFKDNPFEILDFQTYNNHVVSTDAVIDAIRNEGPRLKAKMLRTKIDLLPTEWLPKSRGLHDREDAALAIQTARIFKVSDEIIQPILEKWKPLRGRLEPLKKIRGVEFWNDTASVSPQATVAALATLASNKDVVVILGGAANGGDYRELYAALAVYAHTAIVLPGSGTLTERQALRNLEGVEVISVPSIEEAVRTAMEHARKGDKILFSPAFAAGGLDGSRAERGERFLRAVRSL